MGLSEVLGAGPVALDTAVFIYLVEENPRWLGAVEPIFTAIADGHLRAVTSELTLLEVLVVPYRVGHETLAADYESLLTQSRGLDLVPLDRPLLRAAARLRAATSVKTPDAIQLAAALVTGCTAFVTNDRALPSLPGLRVVQLTQLAE